MTRLFEIGLIGRIFFLLFVLWIAFFHWCSAPSFVEIYSLVLAKEMITSFTTDCFDLRWSKSNHRFWSRLFRKGTVVHYLTIFSCKRMLYSFEHTLSPHRNKFCDKRSVVLEKIWTYILNIFVCCLFGFFPSHLRIFHSYGDIMIAGEGLHRHSLSFSRRGSLAWHTYSTDRTQPNTKADPESRPRVRFGSASSPLFKILRQLWVR